MSAQLDFIVDAKTYALIEKLRAKFNAKGDADLFRKLLALTKVAVDHADEDGVILMRGKNAAQGVAIALRA